MILETIFMCKFYDSKSNTFIYIRKNIKFKTIKIQTRTLYSLDELDKYFKLGKTFTCVSTYAC